MLIKFLVIGVEWEIVKVYERLLGVVKVINGCVNKGMFVWDWFIILKWIIILIKKNFCWVICRMMIYILYYI